jgi:hypothetical protein
MFTGSGSVHDLVIVVAYLGALFSGYHAGSFPVPTARNPSSTLRTSAGTASVTSSLPP